jgi:hypothetical protein
MEHFMENHDGIATCHENDQTADHKRREDREYRYEQSEALSTHGREIFR